MNGDLRSLANGELDMEQFAELDLSPTDEARIDALVRGSLTVNVIDLRAENEAADADDVTDLDELLAWRAAVERVKADIAHARENPLPLPCAVDGASKLVRPPVVPRWHWVRTLGAPQFVAAAAAVLLVVMAGAAVLSRGGSHDLGSPRLDGVDSTVTTSRGSSTSTVAPLYGPPATPLTPPAAPALALPGSPDGGFTSTTQPPIDGPVAANQQPATSEPSVGTPSGSPPIVSPITVVETRSPRSIAPPATDLKTTGLPTSTSASPGTTSPTSGAPAPSTTTTAATPATTPPATVPSPTTTTTSAQPPASCLAGVTADPSSATTIHTFWTAACANNGPLNLTWSINGSVLNAVSVASELRTYDITGLPAGSVVTVTFSAQGNIRQLTVQLPIQ